MVEAGFSKETVEKLKRQGFSSGNLHLLKGKHGRIEKLALPMAQSLLLEKFLNKEIVSDDSTTGSLVEPKKEKEVAPVVKKDTVPDVASNISIWRCLCLKNRAFIKDL